MKRRTIFAFVAAAALAAAGCGDTASELDENGMVEEPAENEGELFPEEPELLAAPARCRTSQRRCGGRCVDTRNDARNCGACGRRCAAGARCTNSRCVRPPRRDAGRG